jgi:hypothetical protein
MRQAGVGLAEFEQLLVPIVERTWNIANPRTERVLAGVSYGLPLCSYNRLLINSGLHHRLFAKKKRRELKYATWKSGDPALPADDDLRHHRSIGR